MRALSSLCAGLWPLFVGAAHAQVDDDRLRLMRETIAYTDVIDAFDGDDRFDLNVQLAYERMRDVGTVSRERTIDGEPVRVDVAQARREVSQLALGVDVGLFRDVMAFVRLPLILSDRRTLARPDGVSGEALAGTLQDDGDPQPLFDPAFTAPTRAGVDHLAFGAAWAVINQMRRPMRPTWVVRIEGRRPIGPPLRACTQPQKVTRCGSVYTDEDGVERGTRVTDSGDRGSSQRLAALRLETRFSRRYRHVEPYGGLSFQLGWAARSRRAGQRPRFPVDPRGKHVPPGPETGGTLGLAFIPWENRGAFQRFAFDLRLDATYVATGPAYSALFDALGTSENVGLARARTCGEGAACSADAADFHGVTEVGAHVRYGGQLGIEVQAARYVRFAVGASLRWVTNHALTGKAPCLAGGAGGVGDDGRTCTGRVDLTHRGVIDAPGRRFFVSDALLLGAYAQAAAMF